MKEFLKELNELNEDFSNKVWMIRTDGKVFDLKGRYVHPLLKPSWTKENLILMLYDVLDDLVFYHENTRNLDTKEAIEKLINMLLYFNDSARHHLGRLSYTGDITIYTEEPFDIQGLYKIVAEECAQEFIKVRLGGMYNSSMVSKEMVFRIASYHFNWFNNIWKFVMNNKEFIDTVTIVRDKELTGEDDFYKQGRAVFNKFPVNDFIELSGSPIIESHDQFIKKLSEGKSIMESYGVQHYRHASRQFEMYKYTYENIL